MKKTITTLVAVIALVLFAAVGFASVTVDEVRINGDTYRDNDTLRVEVGQSIDIRIRLEANENFNNTNDHIEASARLVGYRHADREPLRTFDVKVINRMYEGDVEFVTLRLDAPVRVYRDEVYSIRINVQSRLSSDLDETMSVELRLVGERNQIEIRRVSFDPEEVVAGRAFRTRVRLENIGETDERDVHVTVAIPELGLRATADVGRIDENEIVTSEDILLRIPECTEAGVYNVEVTVKYDDDFSTTTSTEKVRVLASDCPGETSTQRAVITPPASQQLVAGAGAVSFPLTIRNEGTEDRIYQVSVSGVNGWATAEIANPTPLVRAGRSETVQVYVAALSNAPVGNQVFTITVSDGVESKDVPVAVTVAQAQRSVSETVRNVLLVGVIILLLLVIILGLIIGFNKVKGNNEKEYY